MNTSSSKSGSILSEKRIKLHHFETSNRKIWTIVGEKKEYWLDPDLDFCSCPGYYFNNECYHLEWFPTATIENKIEIITFSDHEYGDFIAGLLSDL